MAISLLLFCGCGGAAPLDVTDAHVCSAACTSLTNCGVLYDNTCAATCLSSDPVFIACARNALGDCNGLAMCAFRQAAVTACGGVAGIPVGAATCAQAGVCEASCGTLSEAPGCVCDCWSALAPSRAINLLINNQCATARCPIACGPNGSGSQCQSCFAQMCSDKESQCASH